MYKPQKEIGHKCIVLMKQPNTFYCVAITILYWLVSILLFNRYGVKCVNDTYRYLEYSSQLSHGFYFDPHNFWYIGYVSLIHLIGLATTDLFYIVASQILLGYLAVLALYHASLLVFKDRNAALATALYSILFVEIPTWNMYMLSESFYYSFTCFSLYALALSFKTKNKISIPISVALVFFTFSIKPTGIALMAAACIVILSEVIKRIKTNWAKITLISFFTVGIVLLANRMLTTYNIIENYKLGEVIYGITTLPPNPEYKNLVVSPPLSIYIPDKETMPVIKIISFIANHPLYWAQLFATKIFYLLAHVRPYWSPVHNISSLLFLLPIYFLFLKTVRGKKVDKPILLFAVVYLSIHMISVGVTSEDWDGRFLLPMLPVFFLFAGSGAAKIIRKCKLMDFQKKKQLDQRPIAAEI